MVYRVNLFPSAGSPDRGIMQHCWRRDDPRSRLRPSLTTDHYSSCDPRLPLIRRVVRPGGYRPANSGYQRNVAAPGAGIGDPFGIERAKNTPLPPNHAKAGKAARSGLGSPGEGG